MAHGENAESRGHPGKEYWKSRLHRHGETPGRFTKRLTHRKERRAAGEQIRAEVEGPRPRKVRRRRDPAAAARQRQRIRDAVAWFEAKLGW